MERAFDASKYGRMSDSPYLEATIPSLVDPASWPARRRDPGHSIHLQWAPYTLREGTWDERRDELGDVAVRTLEA